MSTIEDDLSCRKPEEDATEHCGNLNEIQRSVAAQRAIRQVGGDSHEGRKDDGWIPEGGGYGRKVTHWVVLVGRMDSGGRVGLTQGASNV